MGRRGRSWTTFAPCFLWVFLGAPHLERLRRQERFSAALSTVTAAVVGVVLNLAGWFARQVLVPRPGGFDGFAAGLAAVGFVGLQRFRWGVLPGILGSAVVGLAYRWLVGG